MGTLPCRFNKVFHHVQAHACCFPGFDLVNMLLNMALVSFCLEWGMLVCQGAHSNMFFSGWNWGNALVLQYLKVERHFIVDRYKMWIYLKSQGPELHRMGSLLPPRWRWTPFLQGPSWQRGGSRSRSFRPWGIVIWGLEMEVGPQAELMPPCEVFPGEAPTVEVNSDWQRCQLVNHLRREVQPGSQILFDKDS